MKKWVNDWFLALIAIAAVTAPLQLSSHAHSPLLLQNAQAAKPAMCRQTFARAVDRKTSPARLEIQKLNRPLDDYAPDLAMLDRQLLTFRDKESGEVYFQLDPRANSSLFDSQPALLLLRNKEQGGFPGARFEISKADEMDFYERIFLTEWNYSNLPEATLRKWEQMAADRLKEIKDRHEGPIFDTTEAMILLRFLHDRNYKSKDMKTWSRMISVTLAHHFSMSNELLGTYPPKLFQFAKQLTNKWMTGEYLPLSEFIYFQHGSQFRAGVLSIDKIQTSPRTVERLTDGIRFFRLVNSRIPSEGRKGDTIIDHELTWTLHERPYLGRVSARLGEPLEKIVSRATRVDYDRAVRDGKFTGLVMPSENIGRFANTLIGYYKGYFEEQGFKFTAGRAVRDFKSELSDWVRTGELDYWIKEEHSRGATEPYIARVINQGTLLIGKRRNDRGVIDQIYLYLPNKRSETSIVPIEQSSLGQWMNERTKDSSAPDLFYLDSSCFGLNGLPQTISNVANKKFIAVGTELTTDTFTGNGDSPVSFMIDGLHRGATFKEMRSDWQNAIKNLGFNERVEVDAAKYLYPDEKQWHRKIGKGIARNIEAQITNTDEHGQPLSLTDLIGPGR